MSIREAYPLLGSLFDYFHQDWDLDYPSVGAALEAFLGDCRQEELQGLRQEIEGFLSQHATDAVARMAVLAGFNPEYDPSEVSGDGSMGAWLRYVRDRIAAITTTS